MPVLTEKEFQDLKKKEAEVRAELEGKNLEIQRFHKDTQNIKSQRKTFLTSTVIIGIFFLALLFTILFQPNLLGLNEGVNLEDDELVIKESKLEEYEKRVEELESKASKYTNPLELDGFYAVQLGAFKKFDTKLSSDNYSVVHNANYKDFNLYTLGVFKTEDEAEKLLNVVQQLDFENAFIGYYKDGERVKSSY